MKCCNFFWENTSPLIKHSDVHVATTVHYQASISHVRTLQSSMTSWDLQDFDVLKVDSKVLLCHANPQAGLLLKSTGHLLLFILVTVNAWNCRHFVHWEAMTRETWKIRMARVAKEVNEMSNEICIDSELVKTHNPLKPIDLQKFLQLDWPLTDPRRHAVHSSCI